MILEIDNVELSFGTKRILSGIYLKGETGKVTTILGSNGCGKSCLLQVIFGSLNPKYKLVRLNKKPILKPLYLTKKVSFLSQHGFVPKGLKLITVFKFLKVSWNEFAVTFNSFEAYKNKKVKLLSGGERRIVETYLILKGKSNIVLLDEPFSHIAPLYIEKIKLLITEVKKQKVIIITDHMYQHVIELADSIYLLKDGHSKLINDLKDLEFYNYLNIGSMD
ncbi:MAG: ATP-binding cassette domain-containing protein [Oceanihabitans sp.]